MVNKLNFCYTYKVGDVLVWRIVKIKESLKDIYGQTLGKEETIILKVTDYNPRVSIPSGM